MCSTVGTHAGISILARGHGDGRCCEDGGQER